MAKTKVALFGASGTMGFQAFQELWQRRAQYDISLLALPAEQKLKQFRAYERQAQAPAIKGPGVAQGVGLKIVWGDATRYEDVVETIRGADWVLDAMAYISPAADYHPEIARAVNTDAIRNILQAIQAEPDGAERIRFIYTGTVAATGNRPPGIHVGRVGDPLKPSIFDQYALTKIAGENLVLESLLKHWASLRMTFIMPTQYRELVNLLDPISLHMPLNAYMENLTDRDAGYGLVQCLDVPAQSDFWRRAYNMGGGPQMRCQAYDYLDRSLKLHSLSGLTGCTERAWFALRNFHMQYFEDSQVLQDYLHYWRDSLDDFWQQIRQDMPATMRLVVELSRNSPSFRRFLEKKTYRQYEMLARNHRNGTLYWLERENQARIAAFFYDRQTCDCIPDWSAPMPCDCQADWRRLDHGYDEDKPVLEWHDLSQAAAFRGGFLLSPQWNGDLYSRLEWQCAFGHTFQARPYTVLKAGHWCPQCIAQPWNYAGQARRNPFFAQVWYADHARDEEMPYPADCGEDIRDADREWAAGKTGRFWRSLFPPLAPGRQSPRN